MTLNEKIKMLEDFCTRQYAAALESGEMGSCVGFTHDGMRIINLFVDDSGRFDIDDPIEEYGEENIKEFVRQYELKYGEIK